MGDGLNKWTGVGNLGQDPELRFTKTNTGVLTMRLACNESWYDQSSKERKIRVEWVSVVVWGKRAERLSKCLTKGSRVLVEGRLQTRSWEDKQGVKRYTTEVVASNVLLLSGLQSKSESVADEQDTNESTYDSDIPF